MRFLFVLFLFVIFSSLAHPTTAATSSEELARLQGKISAKQQEAQTLQQSAHKTEAELGDLRAKLVDAARDEKQSEDRLLDLQAKLDQLQKQEEAQRQDLSEQQAKLSGILAAMLRLSRMPPEVLMLRPETPVDNLRSAILLRRAMPYYAEKAQGLSASLDRLKETRASILEKRKDLIGAQQSFGAKQEKMNALLNERQAWLKATESQRAELTQQIDALSLQAKNAQELLNRVASTSLKLPGRKLKSGPVTFVTPVKGKLVYGFGDPDDVGSDSRGLMLRIRAGNRIVAPADGQVVFAGPFKGYGNILILRHNDDYHSFLAGFGRMDVAVGQVVNAGEPLGRAPMEKGGSVQVYFELRYRGDPIDPMRRMSSTALAARDTSSP